MKTIESKLTDVRENETIKAVKQAFSTATKQVLAQNELALKELTEEARRMRRRALAVSNRISEASEPVRRLGRKFKPPKFVHPERIASSKLVKDISTNFKTIQETIVDESESLQYGGFASKADRLDFQSRRRARRQQHVSVEADPEAGSNVIVHRSSAWISAWKDYLNDNPVVKTMFQVKRSYDESHNVFIFLARSITDTFAAPFRSFFKESETAMVIKEIQTMDPSFSLEIFLKEAQQFIVPEILEALVRLDFATLELWCGEGVLGVLNATAKLNPAGSVAEGKILDLRSLDLITAKIVSDHPVLVLAFQTQQISFLRNSVTGEILNGAREDTIETVMYFWALAKTTDSPFHAHTGGWKLIEMAARNARS